MWAQVLLVFEMKILLIFFKILRQNHNVTFVHQASSVPTYGCVQVSSPSPSPPNLKVLFYNGLLMRRLSRLWVFVDKATSYFDQKWNRSVKPLSISFPQVFIKRSEEALNISFVIKIKFWFLEKTNHIGFKPKCISGLHSLAGVHLLGAPETSASANPGQDQMQNVSRI